jgi:hypothetical protein
MASEHKPTAGSSTSEDFIILREIKVLNDSVLLYFNKSGFNAWFENDNKHIPEVYELEKSGPEIYSFNCRQLPDLFAQTFLTLSVGNDTDRLNYILQENFYYYVESDNAEFFLEEKKGKLLFFIKN